MTTHKGKILIIRLDNRLLAILLRGNQILSVRNRLNLRSVIFMWPEYRAFLKI